MAPRSTPGATSAQVQQAIDKAKAFLYSKQAGGNWEVVPQRNPAASHASVEGWQWGGLTSIATYALLAGRESPQDERLVKAVAFLQRADIRGTYALGMRASVWQLLPKTPQTRAMIQSDVKALRLGIVKSGKAQGQFNYYNGDPNKRIDASVSQYGVLGVWALEQSGAEVPGPFWRLCDEAWRRTQNPDGGWPYEFGSGTPQWAGSTPPMTAAGIASLFITQDYTMSDRGLDCRGNQSNPNIERGMKWMADRFTPAALQQNQLGDRLYTLYGVERIGVASGSKYFGSTDWYDTGADWLVRNQRPDGSWEGHGPPTINSITGAAWGILFLQRGRAPVVFNKLDYATGAAPQAGKDAPAWNQRPRDAANLVRWLSKQTERDLNFQIVNLTVPRKDLHEAPILYVAGSQALTFSDEHKTKLKNFIDDGGMILFNADCANKVFTDSVRALAKTMYPKYEFRALPENHVIYKNQQFLRTNWKIKPVVEGLSNDTRELMILCPQGDPARSWQVQAGGTKAEWFELAANIFLYAVDKSELRYKGDSYLEESTPNQSTTSTLKLARILTGSNPDPEPGGWGRMATILRNRNKVQLIVEPVKPGQGKLDPKVYRVAHLTGTTKLNLGEVEKKEIKDFVNGGGYLIVDAAGNASEFAIDAQAALESIFPEAAGSLQSPIPVDNILYTRFGPPFKPGDISFRPFARKLLGAESRSTRLKGVKLKSGTTERIAIFFSAEDLSTGLGGMPVDGINGYTPASATLLMQKMLLYAQADGKSNP